MKVDNEIHETKQEILRTEQQLIELKQKLKNLEEAKEKGIPLDEHLCNITDFPLCRYSLWDLSFKYGIITVYDLIQTSPKKLLMCRGIGPVKLKKVEEWMSSHGLTLKTSG